MKTIQEHLEETRQRNQKIRQRTDAYRWCNWDTQTRKKRIYTSLTSNVILLLMVLAGLCFFPGLWLYSLLALDMLSITIHIYLLYHV